MRFFESNQDGPRSKARELAGHTSGFRVKSMIALSLRTAPFILLPLILSACGAEDVCGNAEVLRTVKTLFDQREFGQFVQPPPSIFVVNKKTATLNSTNTRDNSSRCSVIITTDLIEIMRFTGQTSEDDIRRIKEEAPKKGLALTKDDLVHYIVQPLASGHYHVTLMP